MTEAQPGEVVYDAFASEQDIKHAFQRDIAQIDLNFARRHNKWNIGLALFQSMLMVFEIYWVVMAPSIGVYIAMAVITACWVYALRNLIIGRKRLADAQEQVNALA